MPNGKEMLDDFELSEKTKDWSPSERFLARQLLEVRRDIGLLPCKSGDCPMPKSLKVQSGISGGIVAAIISIICGVISYFRSG